MKTSQTSVDTRRTRRSMFGGRMAAAAVAVSSCAAMVVTPMAVHTPAASAASQASMDIGSYNIRAGVTTGAFSSAVHEILPSVDVAGFQEVNSHAKEDVLASLKSSGWSYYRAPRFYGEQSPVVWKTSRFQLISARHALIAKSYATGNETGTPKTNPNYAIVVHLKDRTTGDNVSIINVHLIPGGVINGAPQPGRPKTFNAFRASVIGLESLAKSEKSFGHLFVLGDFNIGWAADKRVGRTHMPYKTFGRMSMGSMWATEVPTGKRGSHAGSPSLIDQVYAGEKASSATVHFDMTYSDHYPVVARYMVG